MFLFSSSKDKDERILYFDIGSGTVGGALARVSTVNGKQGKPEVIYSTRVVIDFDEDMNMERFLARMIRSLNEVVVRISETHPGKIKKIYCFLRSPWYASQTRVISYEKNAAFTFNEKIASELITAELKAFERSELERYAGLKSPLQLLEKRTIQTKLNGYATANPFGKKTKSLELSLYLSMSPQVVLEKIQDTIGRYFNAFSIQFASFLFTSFVVARDTFIGEKNFLMVDIGSEITEVSLVKDEMLMQTVSFPLGRNSFIRGLAKELSKNVTEASSLFSLYMESKLTPEAEAEVKTALEDAELVWLDQFQNALVTISEETSLPSLLLLTTMLGVTEFFTKIIQKEKFSQYMVTDKQFKIIPISGATLKRFVNTKGGDAADPLFMIESIYLSRIQ